MVNHDDYDDVEEEDGPGIDFKFDGDGYLGPLAPKYERRTLDVIRQLLQATLEGADITPLEAKVQELYADIDKTIKKCQSEALRDSTQTSFLHANIESYNVAMDAIEQMDEAIEEEDYVLLQDGFLALTEAVAQIKHGQRERRSR